METQNEDFCVLGAVIITGNHISWLRVLRIQRGQQNLACGRAVRQAFFSIGSKINVLPFALLSIQRELGLKDLCFCFQHFWPLLHTVLFSSQDKVRWCFGNSYPTEFESLEWAVHIGLPWTFLVLTVKVQHPGDNFQSQANWNGWLPSSFSLWCSPVC